MRHRPPAPCSVASCTVAPRAVAPCLLALLVACGPRKGPTTWMTVEGQGEPTTLTLNLARPDGAGPHPAVVVLHSGGWQIGHLYEYGIDERIERLADQGFVAVTVEYRLTAEADGDGEVRWTWPAQASDARCAVRWLRAHAGELEVDPDRIGALGTSAGGHLALMLALAPGADDLDDGTCPYSGSPAVAAAVSRVGPADVPHMAETSMFIGQGFVWRVLGLPKGASVSEAKQAAWAMSPLHRARLPTAPVLQSVGTRDPIVPAEGAEELHAWLQARGQPSWLVPYADTGHLFRGAALEAVERSEERFLRRALGLEDGELAPACGAWPTCAEP